MTTYQIQVLDLNFQSTPQSIASFLISSPKGHILVESGPHSTFPTLVNRLQDHGLTPKDLSALLLTHIHLDHAAAAWAIAQDQVPVYVHTVGVKHLIDPSRLIASATRLYQEQMHPLWGSIQPIKAEHIISAPDQANYTLAGLNVQAHHTPGHARHHIAWQIENNLFSGDVAGVRIQQGPTIAPLPPPDINIAQWLQSIQHIRKLDIENLYLTHFGLITGQKNIQEHLNALEENIQQSIAFLQKNKDLPTQERTQVFEEFIHKLIQYQSPNIQKAYLKANPPFMSALMPPDA